MTIDERAESIYKRMFTKYYPPSSPIWDKSPFLIELVPKGQGKQACIDRIKELLADGMQVKSGWTGTKIRGYRDNYLFYKEPNYNTGFKWKD